MLNLNLGVTVVIPTFNRPLLLPKTIESVLRQTHPAREIIVVNNGDEGDLSNLIDSFGGKVRLIHQEPGGVQRARNAGIEAASTDWIATLDDDDLYRPNFLADMAPAMSDGRANIVFSDHRKFNSSGAFAKTNFESAPRGYWEGINRPAAGENWSYVGRFPIQRLLSFIAFYPSTMIVHRSLFDEIGGYDPRVRGIPTEDIEFLIRALNAGRLSVNWEALVDYRVHDSNTAGNYDKQRIGRWQLFEFVSTDKAVLPAEFRRALQANLPGRRRDIYDFAFHKGRFDVLEDVAGRLAPEDWTFRRQLYRHVAKLPRPFNAYAGKVVSLPARTKTALKRRFGAGKSVFAP